MLRNIIHRPIAVTMTLIAIATLGVLALRRIPVSLMPDVDLPRIVVQMSAQGSSAREIEQQDLPLPHRDFLPETIEEKIICYADKFYSKSHLDRCKTLPQAEKTVSRFGDEGLQRFLLWERMFE